MASPRGAESSGARQAHGVPRDHPKAIREAIDNPRELDRRLVDAQEARRILDRLYGYEVSPVLWKKVMPRLSAGRVQSVATRIVVERERERMRFVTARYWDLQATFAQARRTRRRRAPFVRGHAHRPRRQAGGDRPRLRFAGQDQVRRVVVLDEAAAGRAGRRSRARPTSRSARSSPSPTGAVLPRRS